MSTRHMLMVVGAIGSIVFFAAGYHSIIVLLASGVALFLGVTDFGRQCPLFLSVRHLVARWRHRHSAGV